MSDAAEKMLTELYFDEFFETAEKRTVDVPVVIRGHTVLITIKAGLSVADRLAAQGAALKKLVKPNGELVILGIDETAITEEMLLRAIVAWPFINRDGSPVPITRENLRKMVGGVDTLAEALKTIDEQGEAALTPFVAPSAED